MADENEKLERKKTQSEEYLIFNLTDILDSELAAGHLADKFLGEDSWFGYPSFDRYSIRLRERVSEDLPDMEVYDERKGESTIKIKSSIIRDYILSILNEYRKRT
jgi:hypothetical protein